MMTLIDYILLANSEAIAAASAPRSPLPPVDPAAVDAVIATIHIRARAEKHRDPDATLFCLTEWDPRVRAAVTLGQAVADRVAELGFTVHFEFQTTTASPPRPTTTPRAIFLSYEDLATIAAIEIERRAAWLEEARMLWRKVAGDADASIDTMPSEEGTVVQFTTHRHVSPAGVQRPARFGTRPSMKTWQSDVAWNLRPCTEVVGSALDILRPIVWDFEEVQKIWRDRTGGTVVHSHGLWSDEMDGSNPVDTLIFGIPGRELTEHTVAQTENHALTSEELVSKVAGLMGVETKQAGKKAKGPQANSAVTFGQTAAK